MNLADVMEEIAAKLRAAPTLAGRTFAWPVSPVPIPGAIVTYPTDGKFDATYGRGVDTMTGVVVVMVGKATDRQTRDQAAKYLNGSGVESVKALLDGDSDDYDSCDGVRVADWETDVHTVAAVDHLALIFRLEIAGPGTA
jgi:hypothetical protein